MIPFLRSAIALGMFAAAPKVSSALRGLLDEALEQGEPLRVTVQIEPSGEGNGRVEIAAASGTASGPTGSGRNTQRAAVDL